MARKIEKPLKAKVDTGHPLYDIVERAYQVFAYPKPVSTEVFDCCMYPEIEADFFQQPIRELPLHYVQDWYWAEPESEGVTKSLWGYLLPRILEILAAGEPVAKVAFEVALKRYDTGNSDNWSAEEWAVLDAFQRTVLKQPVGPGYEEIDQVLCLFRLGGWPLNTLIHQVLDLPDEDLVNRFWRDWFGAYASTGGGCPNVTSFWQPPDEKTMYEFYISKPVYDKISRAALSDSPAPHLAERALIIASMIETLSQNYRRS